jgi:hypothetical protein
MKEAPVARIASTCLSEISSIASAKSLATKPMEATVSARISETDRLDEQDRDNDLVKRAAQRDQQARRPRYPGRHQVACSKQAYRQRK